MQYDSNARDNHLKGANTLNKKLKKMSLISAVASMALIAACGGNNAENNAEKPENKAGNANQAVESSEPVTKFDPPVTITTARAVTSSVKFKAGESIEDNVHTRWAKDTLGIDIKYDWTTGDFEAYKTKLKLSMASGEGLPDVFFMSDINLQADLMESGQVLDIKEAFDKYASQRIKDLYAQYPGVLDGFTKDGQLLALPLLADGDGTDSVMWIRQDWLDKLGLQAPKTMDELDKVLDAFVNQDPDGNGKKDTFGLSISLKNGLSSWMTEGSWIAGAYGDALPKAWVKGEGDTLVYGGIQPNVKQAIGKLHDWYEKGIIDPEAGIQDEVKASESFVQGKTGVFAGPSWAYGWPLADTLKNNPNAKIVPIALPSGPDGNVGRRGIQPYEGVLFFDKDFKNMDAFFLYLDKIYGNAFQDKDSEFFWGFHEGYDYAVKDGLHVYGKDNIGGEYTPKLYLLTEQQPKIPFSGLETLKKFEDPNYKADPNVPRELELGSSTDRNYILATIIMKGQTDSRIVTQFTGTPTKTMSSKQELLDKLELEALTKIVYGKEPVDYFDTFVQNWLKSGGEQITKEVNEWYASTK